MSKCVVIGVTGGIAVYKVLDVISALRKKDIKVHVIMTESASKFVNPLTFQSISQNGCNRYVCRAKGLGNSAYFISSKS